jgi:hypothetical protein
MSTKGSYRVRHGTFARPSWDTFYFEIARWWHECGATIAEILRRSIHLKLTLMKLLCDYKTLLKRWLCDSKWALTLERQFITVFSLDFVSFRWISFYYFTDFVSFRWISFSYVTDFVGFCFRFISFLSLPVPWQNPLKHQINSYD